MKYCCDAFASEVEARQIEFTALPHASWCVNGCCGGGCYVLQDLVFCPWCSAQLKAPSTED